MRRLIFKFAGLLLVQVFAAYAGACAGAVHAADHSELGQSKSNVRQFMRQGALYTNQLLHKEAIRSYTAAIDLDPACAEAYVARGSGLSRLGDDQRAILDFNQALRLQPYNAETLGLRGEAKSYSHDKAGAIDEDFTKSIAIRKDIPYVFVGRAEARIDLQDYNGAIEDCNAVLKYMPNDCRLLIDRARAENGIGKYKAACRDLSVAMQHDLRDGGKLSAILILSTIILSILGLIFLIPILRQI